MAEESQEVPENTVKEPENAENAAEKAPENAPENAPEIEAANSKRRGRPAGSKDKAPRKKKIVVVEAEVSEPAVPPEEEPKPPPKKTPKPTPKKAQSSAEPEEQPSAQPSAQPSEQLEPLSPNTIVREASRHILKLKSISAQARRDHIFQTYTAKLHAI